MRPGLEDYRDGFVRYLATLALNQRLRMGEDAVDHDFKRTLLFEYHTSQIQQNLRRTISKALRYEIEYSRRRER